MRLRAPMRLPLLAALALIAAGCVAPTTPPGPTQPPLAGDPAALRFSEPLLIDEVRAGGEPVIAVTRAGVLVVSAHPGFTHYHASSDPAHLPVEILAPFAGQSFVWRSTDQGATWAPIGLPNAPGGEGPRGAGFGVSDPDLTVTADNVVYLTDLEGLAAASVSWSSDDGATWVEGNPAASGAPVDRQWLASHQDTVYFTANYFSDHRLLRSTDGLQWERLGDVPCSGDLLAAPDGTLYAGCGSGVAVSEDGGTVWEERAVPGHENSGRALTEPAVDGAGNVWLAWHEDEASLWLAGSPDKGITWPWVHDLTPALRTALGGSADLTVFWPWVSAGSAGRVAVTAYASPTPPPSDDPGQLDRSWSVVTIAAFDTAGAAPVVSGHVVKEGFHVGPVCQAGTSCQTRSMTGDPTGDRRLGDFFETTIDAEGWLHIVYSDTTTRPTDVISHPGYVRQTAGPRFVTDGFFPLQG